MRARSVQRVRAVGLIVVRGAVVVLAAIGLWLLLRNSFFLISGVLPSQYGPAGQRSGVPLWVYTFVQSPGFSHGVSFCVLAVLLAAFSRWITRFVFRPPAEACPRCEHALTSDDSVCSECGQRGLG
jgi:hypothetical protein